jgi:hypothetical protein
MSITVLQKRRKALVMTVILSLLILFYTVLMISVNISSPPYPKRNDEVSRKPIIITQSMGPRDIELTTQPSKNEEEVTSNPIIKVKDVYPSGFSYPNLELCLLDGMGVKLLIIVMSAPANFLQRKAIRQTWGHYAHRSDVIIAFLIGETNQTDIVDGLKQEMALYNDILQANLKDSYQNLTLKTMAMLEWTSSYCSMAEYLLKSDDDMFINVDNLLEFIDKIDRRAEPKIYGHLIENRTLVDRNEKSKHFVPYDQFSENRFPPYVAGPAYLFSTVIAKSFFQKGMETRFMPIEDAFMTGLIAEEMNVTRVKVNEFQSFKIELVKTSRCVLSKYISIHMVSYHEQFEIWRKVSDGKTGC